MKRAGGQRAKNPGLTAHWTALIESAKAEGKAPARFDYDEQPLKNSPEAAATLLSDLYERILEMDFENAIAEFYGLYQLIRHNPHFKPEVEAIHSMICAEGVLNQFSAKVRGL
ncbi:MAG TPA: hypothetical protein P5567_07540 [Kiritimatiellia bacterium]|nr:hypothetical protein [Kiritimatiellia bacterium]HSA17950.1 hypothetical protein [Kiritimatiellia bacterium]